jgi:hypothetical protein
MKMISLEMPKKKKSEMKMDMDAPTSSEHQKYPYGTTIRLEGDIAKKFECLEECGAGDVMELMAKAKVVQVRQVEKDGEKPAFEVELQLTDMNLEPDEEGEMDDGFEKASNSDEED